MEDYVKREVVEELILKYYDKFDYDSDADELLGDLDTLPGVELVKCQLCPRYGICSMECDVDFVGLLK